MSYIRGYSEVLENGIIESPEEAKEYLHIIHEESQRLEGLVNDLFALAQADAHMLQIDKHPVALEPLVRNVVERLRKRAEEKQIHLSVSMSALPDANVDAMRIEQVLVNLIDNAIRYTPVQGSIEVRLARITNSACIEVEDTGIGIPTKDLPHIWDRLYRVEKSRSRAVGGTGLGLAVVKQIVGAHDGTASVRSAENEGTTFTVKLPLE